MSQLSGTLRRSTPVAPAVARLVVVGALVIALAAAALGAAIGIATAPSVGPVAVRADRAAILAQIHSEYLRSIARGWYVQGPSVDANKLYSEYLREISRDW